MRLSTTESDYLLAVFSPNDTVTIDVYNLSNDALTVDDASMAEVANTGTFKYNFSQATAGTYYCIASNGTSFRRFKQTVGGYVDDKAGYELKTSEHGLIATKVEQSIMNEGDGEAVLNAIVGAIGNQNIDQVAIVAAIRADMERTGGKLDLIPDSHVDISNLSTHSQGDVITALTSHGYTSARAVLLDHLDTDVSNAGGGLDEAGLHTSLNSYTNKADWKGQANEQAIIDGVIDKVLN